MKKLCPRKDASLSGVPTQVGTSDCRKFRRVSGLPGSLKKSARVSGVIPTSGVPTKVGSSDCREFRLESGLPTGLPTYLTENPVRIWPFGFRSELFQTRGKLRK